MALAATRPLQWAGTITSGARAPKASAVGGMTGANRGPGQVEGAHHGVDPVDTGELLGAADDVDERSRSGLSGADQYASLGQPQWHLG
jgi:hypothetical protein